MVELNDASIYHAIRKQKEGDTSRNDEYVGSSNNTGRIKLEKKKWTPSKPVESSRVDDWLGAPSSMKKSYKVKSVSTKPPKEEEPAAPTPPPKPSVQQTVQQTVVHEPEPKEEPKDEPEPQQKEETQLEPEVEEKTKEEPTSRSSAHVELNDPSAYIALRHQKEGETSRNDEYVGASNNTGRVKLEKKKWNSSKNVESSRVDDWVGAPPSGARRSWKVKAKSTPALQVDRESPPRSTETTRKWKPPAKDAAVPSSAEPEKRSSTHAKWKPHSSNKTAVEHPPETQKEETLVEEVSPVKNESDSEYEVDSDSEQEEPKAKPNEKTQPEPEPKEDSQPEPPTKEQPKEEPTSRSSAHVELNDPSAYIALRHQKEGETSRNDEYVGASNNTGRVKLEKKKWTPSKPVESTRVDDWLGSGKSPSKRSWKVKK